MLFRTIKGALRSSENRPVRESGEKLSQQAIFSHPTTEQLADLFAKLYVGVEPSLPGTLDSVQDLIQKYDSAPTRIRTPPEIRSGIERECVLVTGTTGGLGSHLLAVLLESERVERVWAVNRKSLVSVAARQEAAFEDKALDVDLLNSPKLVLLEGELEAKRFGLEEHVYQNVSEHPFGGK